MTVDELRALFPAPHTENPLAGDPWWQLQGLGLLTALQLYRLLPETPHRDAVLWQWRETVDRALEAVPAPPDEEVARRRAQTLAPYVPTAEPVVEAMLEVAALRPGERLVDLGSGDGRIVLAAARRGAWATGIEIDARLVEEARARAAADPAGERARFVVGDVEQTDWGDPDVVTCYLVSAGMERIAARCRALRPGTRIVSHAYPLPGWPVQRVRRVGDRVVYGWVVGATTETGTDDGMA